ncbi:MAG: murein biosynthesis integral membrane protein MurJ [Burkholderiales bacterium]
MAERYLEATAYVRTSLIKSGLAVNAGSMIDADITPNSAVSIVAYAPRAVQIALFAPFPTQWFEKISAPRLVAVGEMLIWYLAAPGVLLAFYYRRRSPRLLMTAAFAMVFLYIYGFTIANVGTLYRIRYPFVFLFMLAGIAGWIEFMLRGNHWALKRLSPSYTVNIAPPMSTPYPGSGSRGYSRSNLINAGAMVSVLTAITYFGLFIRDIIMARQFGLGDELDAFFVATMLPMFLVSVFSIPLGTTIIPAFLDARERRSVRAAQELLSRVSFMFAIFIVLLAVLLYLLNPLFLPLIGWSFTPQMLEQSKYLLLWTLPILALSGHVVLASSTANALGKYIVPACGQIMVPLFAIFALLLFHGRFGVMPVVIGMFAGQIAALSIVSAFLHRQGVSVFPRWAHVNSDLGEMFFQYLPLVVAALFINLATPVNTAMASSLPPGSVAALTLGNKIVLFMTGVIGTGVATVILPYFSAHMARNRLLDIRRELSFFLMAATAITVPLSVTLYLGARPLVELAFQGGVFQIADVSLVAKIMSYGVLQLPFFTSNILVLKFAIATRHSGRVMVASLLGLCINVILNLLLMEHSGVAGIALAASLSVAVSSGALMLTLHRLGHILWSDIVTILINWMLFMTFVLCLHYQSYAGVFVTALALLVLMFGQWGILIRDRAAVSY